MARSKFLILIMVVGLCLSACGESLPSSTPVASRNTTATEVATTILSTTSTAITTPAPVQTQPVNTTIFATTVSPTTPFTTRIVDTTAPPPSPVVGAVYLVETNDSGLSWSALITQTNPVKVEYSGFGELNCIGKETCMQLNYTNDHGFRNLGLVKDGPKNWKPFFTIYQSNITCLSSIDCWEVVYNGYRNGVYVTHDGGKVWSSLTRDDNLRVNAANQPIYLKARRNETFGSEIAFTRSISCGSASRCLLVGGGGRSIRTVDGGKTWDWFFTEPTFYYEAECFDENFCYAYGPGNFAITENFGETWRNLQIPATMRDLKGFNCFSVNECTVISSKNTIISTQDKGVSWNEYSLNISASVYLDDVSCPASKICYAITSDSKVWFTQDAGKTWNSRPTNLNINVNYYKRISCPTANNCFIADRVFLE